MSTKQSFGGPWTVEKLNILSNYLNFYTTALKHTGFQLIYIDAFAGTGKVKIGSEERYEEIDGSAKLALQSKGQFTEYIFIEKKKSFAKELNDMVESEFPDKKNRVKIKNDDCNQVLIEICNKVDWRKARAVLFIDPYAADVKWETLKAVAATGAIDVWYLFPFSAVNRMMKRDGRIESTWEAKLNSVFGDNTWKERFYREDPQLNFFSEIEIMRDFNQNELQRYVEERLGCIFTKVSSNSRILFNRKNCPLFLFCFAVSSKNPNAIGLAMKVANYILKDQKPN